MTRTTPTGFQVFCDPDGNLWVQDGTVMQLRTGVRIAVGSGDRFDAIRDGREGDLFMPLAGAIGATFVGGSGRNLVLSGLSAPLSGPVPPVGLFRPTILDTWQRGVFTLAVTGASAATIHDGTDIVAELTSGGTAPVGDYVATTYGRTTYNDSTAFTIAAVLEIAGGGVIPNVAVTVSAGTVQTGVYEATAVAAYESGDDADWTIVIDPDGSAELLFETTPVATRAAGASPYDPAGFYVATAAGMAAFNLTDAEPVNGEPFIVCVETVAGSPRAGFVYLTITQAAGVLTSVAGPDFATSLPTDTADVYHIPLAQSDGAGGMEQFHTGLLVWPEP